jgi:hypothetical protein
MSSFIITTKVLFPQEYVTLAEFGYLCNSFGCFAIAETRRAD